MSIASLVLVGPRFDACWPYAAEHAQARLAMDGPCALVRLPSDAPWAGAGLVPAALASGIQRLLLCQVGFSQADRARFPALTSLGSLDGPAAEDQALAAAGLVVRRPRHEGFWGQSVAEFALGLTIAGLRRIPQCHAALHASLEGWDYTPTPARPRRGIQFGDDPAFVNGTIAGKRIGVVGLGNIGARYAAWCSALGADVLGWDPVAPEPVFHRTGTRRVDTIEQLVEAAEILAPMMPLRDGTAGLVTAAHVRSLAVGALVVLVTRAGIVDMPTLRQRVLAGELALAADVFDVEPLPLDDPLLGLGHVVLTPHNAGRTVHANQAFADHVLEQMRIAPTPARALPAAPARVQPVS
jgi:phosphoglycerate dehydrogenase-like enzyme